jgi:hypothetical protein
MKLKIIIVFACIVVAANVWGLKLLSFPGWDRVREKSTDIIVAQCLKVPNNPGSSIDDLLDTDIQIDSVLKGSTNLAAVRLRTTSWLRPGEYYLIFAISMDRVYNAFEKYRVIPLGSYIPPDLLIGKAPDEQIQILFQRRLDDLHRQMTEEEQEKQRLEEGIKK